MQKGRKDVRALTGVSIFMAIKCTAELDIMTPPTLPTAFPTLLLPAMWQQEELPYSHYLFLGLKRYEKKNPDSIFFIVSFLIYVTWLPGKLLLYMSANTTKRNDGLIRTNTGRCLK